MTYPEALEYLYGLQRFGMRPGLETTARLCALAGNPERDLRFLHVAGTNGKGSTCAFLESMCRAAGHRTGLYTSPHLVSFRERLQVDRGLVDEATVARWVGRLRDGWASAGGEEAPTFFEFVTVMALGWFREQGCQVVIWETGMGGRLDATNVVTPLAAAITNVGLDHQQWLGDTPARIAAEKAGIFKPGVPALTASTDPEVLDVLRAEAAARGTTLREVSPTGAEAAVARSAGLALSGEHQVANAALAVATLEAVRGGVRVDAEAVTRGLRSAQWPGRLQEVTWKGRRLVLDGAHNGPAFRVLGEALRARHGEGTWTLILGVLADKDPEVALRDLVPRAKRVVVVPVHTARGGDPEELAARCARATGAPVERAGDVEAALERVPPGETAVVTGSLYLVGEALDRLDGGSNSERALNDWSPRR